MHSLKPDLVFADRYLLKHELGRGGMGSVWEAHDQRLDRPVAIKTMVEEFADSETALARFQREARAVARIRSPHIVEIHDYGVSPVPFMVMERLKGEDLKARHRERGWLEPTDVARIVSQVSKALTAAHDEGIVHRDLKPGNIFLTRHHDEDFVKVFDFGIAKALHGEHRVRRLTQENMAVGTPLYMSPEQLMSKPIDHRADVWSLAVIAYRGLTGTMPFRGKTLGEIVGCVMSHDPVMPSELDPELPKALDELFQSAFTKEIDQRFQSAKQLAEALLVALDITLQPERGGATNTSSPRISTTSDPALPVTPADKTAPTAVAYGAPDKTEAGLYEAETIEQNSDFTLKKAGGWARRDATSLRKRRIGAAAAGISIGAIAAVAGWLVLRPTATEPAAGAAPAMSTTVAQQAAPTETATGSSTASLADAPPPPPPPVATTSASASSEPSAKKPASAPPKSAKPVRPPVPPPTAKASAKPSGDDLFDSIY